MSSHDNVDDDDLDDPITLVDFEQDRFIASAAQVIDVDETTLGLDDVFEILKHGDENELPAEKIKVSACDKSFILSDNFFNIAENIELMNKCKPLDIRIVDCCIHSYYYKKYIPGLDEDKNERESNVCVGMEITETNIPLSANPSSVIDNNMKSNERSNENSKIPTENTTYSINNKKIQVIKRKSTEKWIKLQQAKQDNEKSIAISQKNLTKVDYKKNTGLIGLKIKQSISLDHGTTNKNMIETSKETKAKSYKTETKSKQDTKKATDKKAMASDIKSKYDKPKNTYKVSSNKPDSDDILNKRTNSDIGINKAENKTNKSASSDSKPKDIAAFSKESNKIELPKVATVETFHKTENVYKNLDLCLYKNNTVHETHALPLTSVVNLKQNNAPVANRFISPQCSLKDCESLFQKRKLPLNVQVKTQSAAKRKSNEVQNMPDRKSPKILGEIQKQVYNKPKPLSRSEPLADLKNSKEAANSKSHLILSKDKVVIDTPQQMINFLNSESSMLSKSFAEKGATPKSNMFADYMKRMSPSAKAKVKIHPIKTIASSASVKLIEDLKTLQEGANIPKPIPILQKVLPQINHNQNSTLPKGNVIPDLKKSLSVAETSNNSRYGSLADPRKQNHPLRHNLLNVPIQVQIGDNTTYPKNIGNKQVPPRNIVKNTSRDQSVPVIKGTPLPRSIPTYKDQSKQQNTTPKASIKIEYTSIPVQAQDSLHVPPINNNTVLPHTNYTVNCQIFEPPLDSTQNAFQPQPNIFVPPMNATQGVNEPSRCLPAWTEPYQNYNPMPPVCDVMTYPQYDTVPNYSYYMPPENVEPNYPWYGSNNVIPPPPPPQIVQPPPTQTFQRPPQYKNMNNKELTNHLPSKEALIGKIHNGILRKINILTATSQKNEAKDSMTKKLAVIQRNSENVRTKFVPSKLASERLIGPKFQKYSIVSSQNSQTKKGTNANLAKPSNTVSKVASKPETVAKIPSHYSPPILPIPTYQKTLEMFGQVNTYPKKNTDNTDLQNSAILCMNGYRKIELGNEMPAKKISITEYKNRLPKYDSRCIDLTGDDNFDQEEKITSKVNVSRRSNSQDLGYASDTTVKI